MSNEIYYLALDTLGNVDEVFNNENNALDFRARNPELCNKIIPVVDLNMFTDKEINTKSEVEEVIEELKQ